MVGPARILVVDDQLAFAPGLTSKRYDLLHARDGEHALNVLDDPAAKVDLLVVGPPGDLDTCRRVRGRALRDLPLVLVAPSADRGVRIDAKIVGVDEVLVVPVDEDELVARIEALLEMKLVNDAREAQRVRLKKELASYREQLLHVDRLATLGTLAAGVAHELRNVGAIHAAVLDSIRVRAEQGLPPHPEDLGALQHVSDHLVEHSRQLLRLGSPGASAKRDLVDLSAVVRSTLGMLQLSGRTKYVSVETSLPELPLSAAVNRTHVEQILVNLVGNAADALEDRGEARCRAPARIRVSLAVESTDDRFARCTVEDTGCGMSPEVMSKMFEPYFTTKGEGRGNGLGLPVVQRLVASLGGALTAHSEPGAGSRFSFTIRR